jgi:hypothetical protein
MDTPLWIYVNNPVQNILTAYTPISGTIIQTPAIKNNKASNTKSFRVRELLLFKIMAGKIT